MTVFIRCLVGAGIMFAGAGCVTSPAAPPAQIVATVGWGPLAPTYDGSQRSWSNGAFENRGSSYANVSGKYRDPSADGNSVYVKTSFQSLYVVLNNTNPTWNTDSTKTTPEIGTADGLKEITNMFNPLSFQSNRARGWISGCSQFGWPVPDPCSASFPSFGY